MSYWDDFIYCGEDQRRTPRLIYLRFCLNCGDNEDITGPRFKIREVQKQALLLENGQGLDCKHCGFPVFTSGHYKKLTDKRPLPKIQHPDFAGKTFD